MECVLGLRDAEVSGDEATEEAPGIEATVCIVQLITVTMGGAGTIHARIRLRLRKRPPW